MAKQKSDPLWIEHANLKKGALHKDLGVAAGRKIPSSTLAKAETKTGPVGRRARLTETLRKLRTR